MALHQAANDLQTGNDDLQVSGDPDSFADYLSISTILYYQEIVAALKVKQSKVRLYNSTLKKLSLKLSLI